MQDKVFDDIISMHRLQTKRIGHPLANGKILDEMFNANINLGMDTTTKVNDNKHNLLCSYLRRRTNVLPTNI